MATVLTIGTFDLFHSGHVDLLHRCRKLAGADGKVIVGLNTDEFVKRYKGTAPIIPFRDREQVLATSQFVDDVFENEQSDAEVSIVPLLEEVRRDYGRDNERITLAAGSDWASKDYHAQIGVDPAVLLHIHRVDLVFLPRPVDGLSTSRIKAALKPPPQKPTIIVSPPPEVWR